MPCDKLDNGGFRNKLFPCGKILPHNSFVVQKFWHYLLSYRIILISKVDPLKYILSKPVRLGRLAKLVMLFAPFDIKFMS